MSILCYFQCQISISTYSAADLYRQSSNQKANAATEKVINANLTGTYKKRNTLTLLMGINLLYIYNNNIIILLLYNIP